MPKVRGYSLEDRIPKFIDSYLVNLGINVFMAMFSIFSMWSLILSSYHYTIDVLAGLLFTVSVWTVFHWIIRIRVLREETWLGALVWFIDNPMSCDDAVDMDMAPADEVREITESTKFEFNGIM